MERQHCPLPPVVGDAERVEGNVEGERIGADGREREPPAEQGQRAGRVALAQVREERQKSSTRTKAQERQADD